MVKKLQKLSAQKTTGAQLSGSVKDSAQQIWLAGLGAFAKAQEEGGKVFETLVKEGLSIQRKTTATAEEKISEATARMSTMAGDISSRASGQWDKLESIFEERVSKAMGKLGVPTSKELAALSARVSALEGKTTRAPAARKAPATKAAAKKAPARKVAAKKAAAKKVAAKKAPAKKAAR